MPQWNFPSVFQCFWSGGLLSLLLGLLVACGETPSPSTAQENAEDDREAVLSMLDTLAIDTFTQAFRALDGLAHRRYVRTEQWAPGPEIIRRSTALYAHAPPGERTLLQVVDSLGTFDTDRMPGFLSGSDRPLQALPSFVLPEDPAYLEPRYAEAFTYTMRSDSTWFGHRMRVIEIAARPGVGDDQAIREVRFYVRAESGELMKLFLQRQDQGLLFGEHTTLDVSIRPHGEAWVPALLRAHTNVGTLLRPTQVFRTVIALYGYADVDAEARAES
ncbi:MAG: hypothetical protein GVY12_06570 [Bacteroidetes bacterium]|jgi:hypothetical protein|nr:hypothetical protein [Bacteroidota bacterium]